MTAAERPTRTAIGVATGAIVVLAGLIAYLLAIIPPVVGLGNKVKLPIYHGASTWVDLMLFTIMGGLAVVYLATRRERVYAWEVGMRAVAAPLWLVNSVLGFLAALSTWDFTGSKESPLVLIRQDPRLMAQAFLLLGVAVLFLLVWLVLDKRWHKALADLGFVVVMWAVLANVFLDPNKAALHPNSPVLHSGWEIKGPFLGIVICIFAITLILAWLVSRYVRPAETPPAVSAAPLPDNA